MYDWIKKINENYISFKEWCKKKNILGRSRLNEISKALETIGAVNVGQCPVTRATPDGQRIHKPTIWIIRNKDKWKSQTLEAIGDHWANDPLNAGIDIFFLYRLTTYENPRRTLNLILGR